MFDRVLPITPEEAVQLKTAAIPDKVFVAFNDLIAANLRDGRAVVPAKEAAELAAQLLDVSTKEVYDSGWMDVEPAYRERGWNVDYDQPAYNESYEACYTFTAK
jgi:hypothetical protein